MDTGYYGGYSSQNEQNYWNMYYFTVQTTGSAPTVKPPVKYSSPPAVTWSPTRFRGITASAESHIKTQLIFNEIREYLDPWGSPLSAPVDVVGREWFWGGNGVFPEGKFDAERDRLIKNPFDQGVFVSPDMAGRYAQTGLSDDFEIGTGDFTFIFWILGEPYGEQFRLPQYFELVETTNFILRGGERSIGFPDQWFWNPEKGDMDRAPGIKDANGDPIFDGVPDRWIIQSEEMEDPEDPEGPWLPGEPLITFASEWIHLVLMRKQGLFYLFLNGVQYEDARAFTAGIYPSVHAEYGMNFPSVVLW